MKRIPAVLTEKAFEPEKYIFEPGDKVKMVDLSYILKLDTSWHDIHDFPSWKRAMDIERPAPEMFVIETGLKVPSIEFNKSCKDWHRNDPVYLDIMIRDFHGNVYLCVSACLFPSEEN